MKAVVKILTGAAGLALAAGAFATPASAQYYPGGGYGGGIGQVILGQVLGQVLGGGRQYGGYGYNGYGANTQAGVQQCAAAVEQRLNGGYSNNYGGYNNGYAGGYNGGYGNNAYAGGRVVSITHADQHSGGRVKVKGYATSGNNAGYGGYSGAYGGGYNNAQADLYFTCEVDYRGSIRDLRIQRNNRGYGY